VSGVKTRLGCAGPVPSSSWCVGRDTARAERRADGGPMRIRDGCLWISESRCARGSRHSRLSLFRLSYSSLRPCYSTLLPPPAFPPFLSPLSTMRPINVRQRLPTSSPSPYMKDDPRQGVALYHDVGYGLRPSQRTRTFRIPMTYSNELADLCVSTPFWMPPPT
jgi:hypothetical protein